ncbi:tyrosine-type recombinase/integrase [Bacillus salitolerans]|uniref:Tyrosine-type recombinase/integrase n=1 Tax=Bacillus salitolerans TaxID=1437434 RepID=A0ABW4LQ31_9BACI
MEHHLQISPSSFELDSKISSQFLSVFMKNDKFADLDKLVDQSEKDNKSDFYYFSDMEVLYYYIHDSKSRNEKTKTEYIRELFQFIQNVHAHADDIGIDIEHVKEGSLFKSLAPRHLKNYQRWLEKTPFKSDRNGKERYYSKSSLARKVNILISFFNYLTKKGYLDQLITAKMEYVKIDKKKDLPNRDITVEQAEALLEFVENLEHPILNGLISTFLLCGIRNNELCTARVCDLSYESGDYYLSVLGKGDERREVWLSPKTFKKIKQFREVRGQSTQIDKNDESPLFTTFTGKAYTPSYLSKYIKNAVERFNLEAFEGRKKPISPHHFRHGFAQISADQGVPLYFIQETLGHKHQSTTEGYLEKNMKREHNAARHWNGGNIKKFL